MRTLIQLILIGLVIMCFSRCSTPEKLISKAMAKDPAAVAKATRDLFPCKDLLRNDTAMVFRDSLIYIDCPDTARTSPYDTDTAFMTPTLFNAHSGTPATRTIRIPVTDRLPGQVITRWYEDSASLFLLHKDIEHMQADTAQLHKNLTSMTSNRNWYRKWFFIELGLLFILLVLALWKFWKRLTTIKFK